jgi:hypothetical protein
LPACSAPPRDPSIPRDRRGIDPRKGVVILTNGMEVPMTDKEHSRWGKEKSRRYLTLEEERWQRGLPAEFEVDDEKTRTWPIPNGNQPAHSSCQATRQACPRCDTPLRVIRPAPRPHWGKLWCDACGRRRGWASTPDSELGRNYTMPYGCYAGRTLDKIAATARGRGYLEWVARDLKDERIRKSVRRYLETRPTDRIRESSSGKPVRAG